MKTKLLNKNLSEELISNQKTIIWLQIIFDKRMFIKTRRIEINCSRN